MISGELSIIQRILKILFTLYFGLNVSFAIASFHECSRDEGHCLEFGESQSLISIDASDNETSRSDEKNSCHHLCVTSSMNINFTTSHSKNTIFIVNGYPSIRLLVHTYSDNITSLFSQNRLFRPPIS